jgi:hypothetical protein
MNQKQALLKYLKTHKSITSMDAMEKLGIVCLHKRIAEIEKDGIWIDRYWHTQENRYGHIVKFMRYSIGKKKPENKIDLIKEANKRISEAYKKRGMWNI